MVMLPPLAPPGSRLPHLPLENPPPLVELGLVDLAPGEASPEDVDRPIRRPGTSRIGRAPVATTAERSAAQAHQHRRRQDGQDREGSETARELAHDVIPWVPSSP